MTSHGAVRPGRRRGRARWLVLLLVLTPVVEIATIVLMARWLGGWPVVGILAAETLLGGWLLAREVPRTWRALRDGLGIGAVEVEGVTIARGPTRLPAKELADASLVLVGGFLLVLPGFVSDVLALVCLIPFTRPLPRALLSAMIARRTAVVAERFRGRARSQDVQGEVMGTVLESPPVRPDESKDRRRGSES